MSVPLRVVTFGYNADCIRPCAPMSIEMRPLALPHHPDRSIEGRKIGRPLQSVALGVPEEHYVEKQQEGEKGKKKWMKVPFVHTRWNYIRGYGGWCQVNRLHA